MSAYSFSVTANSPGIFWKIVVFVLVAICLETKVFFYTYILIYYFYTYIQVYSACFIQLLVHNWVKVAKEIDSYICQGNLGKREDRRRGHHCKSTRWGNTDKIEFKVWVGLAYKIVKKQSQSSNLTFTGSISYLKNSFSILVIKNMAGNVSANSLTVNHSISYETQWFSLTVIWLIRTKQM